MRTLALQRSSDHADGKRWGQLGTAGVIGTVSSDASNVYVLV
jgi:hypothetical protein